MRARPIALVTLLVMWGATLAVAPVVGEPYETLETQLVLQTGADPAERLVVRLSSHDGALVHEWRVEPEPDAEVTVTVPLQADRYTLRLHTSLATVKGAALYDPQPGTFRVHLDDCVERARITIHLDRDHERVHYHETGCLAIPGAVAELAGLVEDAPGLAPESPVPQRSGAVPIGGVWFATDRVDAVQADAHEPEWGDEVVWFAHAEASPILKVARVPAGSAWVRTFSAHSDGETLAPYGWTDGIVAYDATTGAVHGASRTRWTPTPDGPTGFDWSPRTVFEHGSRAPFPQCLGAVPPASGGTTVAQLGTCLRVPDTARWHAADDGRDATLVAVWDDDDGGGIATVTYDATGALPRTVHVYDHNEHGIVTHRSAWLTHAVHGTPAAPAAAPVWQPAPHERLDPLRGPATGPEPPGFAFGLDAAADAAFDDPVVGLELAPFPGAGGVLAGAVYRAGADNAASEGPSWALLFARPDGAPVDVVCTPDPASVPGVAAPDIRCRFDERRTVRWSLGAPPPLGATDLPLRAATWTGAATAWSGGDGETTRAPAVAWYRAWTDDDARWRRAFVGVGDALEPTGAKAPDADSDDLPRQVRIDLHTALPYQVDMPRLKHEQVPQLPRAATPTAEGVADTPTASAAAPHANDPHASQVVTTALVAALALYLWHGLQPVRDRRVLSLIALWAHRDQPGDRHPIRVHILDLVTERPGIIRAHLKEELQVRNGQLDHHLGVLLARDEIFDLRQHGARCFFRTGAIDTDAARRLATLANPTARAARDHILDRPGCTLTDLATDLRVSKGYASRIVHRLADAGHVRLLRDGNRLLAYPLQ